MHRTTERTSLQLGEQAWLDETDALVALAELVALPLLLVLVSLVSHFHEDPQLDSKPPLCQPDQDS